MTRRDCSKVKLWLAGAVSESENAVTDFESLRHQGHWVTSGAHQHSVEGVLVTRDRPSAIPEENCRQLGVK